EPVQGEGGINIPADDYLSGLRQICDDNGWLLILDEIQTGNGRTGTYFNYQQHGILPDVVTTAKGLGNGLPIGACLARGEAANTLKPGNHGSTYGGNPLCCATALTVVNTLVEENLPQRAAELGRRIVDNLKTQLESVAMVREVRGKGLMIGIELTQACSPLVALAKDRGLLINVTAEKVIRLLPALTMSDEESDNMVNLLSQLIKEYAAQ
ncbi:MAG TPA: aspartate aminotransferase family protein, partial [Gammaproteobacteria bacterium]|nr:aspartate aminotransferase family protein [Gammaproteobacteria bacterium]